MYNIYFIYTKYIYKVYNILYKNIYLFVCVLCVCVCFANALIKDKGQLVGVDCLLSLRGSQGWYLGQQAWLQAPLPSEPYHWPTVYTNEISLPCLLPCRIIAHAFPLLVA